MQKLAVRARLCVVRRVDSEWVNPGDQVKQMFGTAFIVGERTHHLSTFEGSSPSNASEEF